MLVTRVEVRSLKTGRTSAQPLNDEVNRIKHPNDVKRDLAIILVTEEGQLTLVPLQGYAASVKDRPVRVHESRIIQKNDAIKIGGEFEVKLVQHSVPLATIPVTEVQYDEEEEDEDDDESRDEVKPLRFSKPQTRGPAGIATLPGATETLPLPEATLTLPGHETYTQDATTTLLPATAQAPTVTLIPAAAATQAPTATLLPATATQAPTATIPPLTTVPLEEEDGDEEEDAHTSESAAQMETQLVTQGVEDQVVTQATHDHNNELEHLVTQLDDELPPGEVQTTQSDGQNDEDAVSVASEDMLLGKPAVEQKQTVGSAFHTPSRQVHQEQIRSPHAKFEHMSEDELKRKLAQLKLTTSGSKLELMRRLAAHFAVYEEDEESTPAAMTELPKAYDTLSSAKTDGPAAPTLKLYEEDEVDHSGKNRATPVAVKEAAPTLKLYEEDEVDNPSKKRATPGAVTDEKGEPKINESIEQQDKNEVLKTSEEAPQSGDLEEKGTKNAVLNDSNSSKRATTKVESVLPPSQVEAVVLLESMRQSTSPAELLAQTSFASETPPKSVEPKQTKRGGRGRKEEPDKADESAKGGKGKKGKETKVVDDQKEENEEEVAMPLTRGKRKSVVTDKVVSESANARSARGNSAKHATNDTKAEGNTGEGVDTEEVSPSTKGKRRANRAEVDVDKKAKIEEEEEEERSQSQDRKRSGEKRTMPSEPKSSGKKRRADAAAARPLGVVFTNITPSALELELVRKLGGTVLDGTEEEFASGSVTHLVCLKGSLKRTLKLLRAMALPGSGSPRVVHIDWLYDSSKDDKFQDEHDYIPFEGNNSMKEALRLRDRDTSKGLFENLTVLVAAKCDAPKLADLAPIVQAAGGRIAEATKDELTKCFPKSTIVLGKEEMFPAKTLKDVIEKRKLSLCVPTWITQSLASYSLKTANDELILAKGSFFIS